MILLHFQIIVATTCGTSTLWTQPTLQMGLLMPKHKVDNSFSDDEAIIDGMVRNRGYCISARYGKHKPKTSKHYAKPPAYPHSPACMLMRKAFRIWIRDLYSMQEYSSFGDALRGWFRSDSQRNRALFCGLFLGDLAPGLCYPFAQR